MRAILMAFALMLAALPAWAQTTPPTPLPPEAQTAAPAALPPDAQAAMKKGILAAQEQEWDIAIQSFQDARKSAPDAPVLFYNLGLAESKIPGRELRAIAWFGAYLTVSPNAQNAAAVNDAIAGLQIKSEGNIDRLIKVVQEADDLIPDAPPTRLLNGDTSKPDIDRVMGLYKVADLWAAAGNSANAIDLAHRIGAAGYNQSESLRQIVVAQAGSGHLADAIKIAASWYDVNDTTTARLAIAAAQAKDGDSAAARATLTAAQSTVAGDQSAYIRNSHLHDIAKAQAEIGDIPGAQRTAGLIPSPEIMGLAEMDIANAQADAGDLAGAQASLLAAQQGLDRWTSLTGAQKTVACECVFDPHENLADLETDIAETQMKAGNIAGARAALLIAGREVAAGTGDKSSSAFRIVEAQAKAGDISGAQETAKLISDPIWKDDAAGKIAVAQAKAGDFAGATKTAELVTNVQNRSAIDYFIGDARRAAEAAAAATASGSPPAPQPDSTPPHRATPPLHGVSLADWTGELDRLNAPIFLDLSEALKTPQATYKTIYPGSSGFDDSNRDPEKIFEALVAIANLEISEKNTIDKRLKQQAKK